MSSSGGGAFGRVPPPCEPPPPPPPPPPLRAFPFHESVAQFIEEHETVYVVEQNRDAQMRTLLMSELGVAPSLLVAVLHYDGTPITARFIAGAITRHVHAMVVKPHAPAPAHPPHHFDKVIAR